MTNNRTIFSADSNDFELSQLERPETRFRNSDNNPRFYDPISMIKLMASATKNLLIINTHCAPETSLRYKFGWINSNIIALIQKRIDLLNFRRNYRLSETTTNEGFRGRLYTDYAKTAKQKRIEQALLSAYNNNKAFWLCKDELVRALKEAGFKFVFEKPDFSDDMGFDYKNYFHRCVIVAKRT